MIEARSASRSAPAWETVVSRHWLAKGESVPQRGQSMHDKPCRIAKRGPVVDRLLVARPSCPAEVACSSNVLTLEGRLAWTDPFLVFNLWRLRTAGLPIRRKRVAALA